MREFVSAMADSRSHPPPPFQQTEFFDDDDERGVREGKRRGLDPSPDLKKSLAKPENQHVLLDYFFADKKSSKDASTHDLSGGPIAPQKFATQVVKVCVRFLLHAQRLYTPISSHRIVSARFDFPMVILQMFHSMRKSSKTLFKLSSQEALLLAKQIVKIDLVRHATEK